MSVYLHATLEVRLDGFERFVETMRDGVVPLMEKQGWRLVGAFVQRTGRLGTVIDLWELEDFQHFDRGINALMQHESYPDIYKVLAATVISETLVFADKAPFSR